MKTIPALACAVLCLLVASAAAAAPQPVADVAPVRVAPHTWVIHGPLGEPSPANQGFMNNPAFVLTEAGVVLIDPGSSRQTGEMVLRQLRRVTARPVVAVLNTHVHGDHWLGNQALRSAFPQVPIYGHPKMIAAIAAGAGRTWLDLMQEMTGGAIAGTRAVPPDHPMEDGGVLEIGGMHFRFHHPGPAHTQGDLMIEVREEGVLFLGDNAVAGMVVRLDDGELRGSIAALDAALATDAQVYVPGHGRTGGPEVAQDYRRFLDTLYTTVQGLYEQGVASDFEMKPQVIAALADYRDWVRFDDAIGRLVSLAYLEVERQAF